MEHFAERYPTGVAVVGDWCLKAWWSGTRQAWLVQVEHRWPERGGWIRGWLGAGTGTVAQFSVLAEGVAAIEDFLAAPTWSQCVELPFV